MAMKETTDSLMDQVDGVTECPICSEKLVNNRLLPCGHTFCLTCLEQYKKQKNPKGKSLPCPICRKEFGIPKGGCASLAKNYALEQLIGIKKSADDNHLVPALCDVCDHERKMVAFSFCLECDQNLCTDCEKTHQRMRSTSTHHALPISKRNLLRSPVNNKSFCNEHTDHRLELVCNECNEPICWKCKSLRHNSHDFVDISTKADQCLEQLKVDFEETESRLFVLNKIAANIKDKLQQQKEDFEKKKTEIAKISSDMIRTIVANEEKLLKKLDAVTLSNMRVFQPQEARVNKQREELKEHKASIKQLVDCGQPLQIFRCTMSSHEQTSALLKTALIDIEDIHISKLSGLQIREHLIGDKSALQAIAAQIYPGDQKRQAAYSASDNNAKDLAAIPKTPPSVSMTDRIPQLKVVASTQIHAGDALEETGYVNATQLPNNGKTDDRNSDSQTNHLEPMSTKRKPISAPLSVNDYVNGREDLEVPPTAIRRSSETPIGATGVAHQMVGLPSGNRKFDGLGDYINCRDDPVVPRPIVMRNTPSLPILRIQRELLLGNSKGLSDGDAKVTDWSRSSTVGKITFDGKAIIGLASLQHRVYVIHEKHSQIQMYDSSTMNLQSEFKVKDLQEPKHLVSCAVNNCLYIAGLRSEIVYKVESDEGKVLLELRTDADSNSLATTKEGNVILIGFLTQTLKEYTTNGTLLRKIILKSDTVYTDINPWHALKFESGNFLICHGKSRTSKHRVCLISPDGDVLYYFGDEKGSDTTGLFGPYHLASDENGNILVADCNNHRIVVLNSSLQYVTEIKTDLRQPIRICLESTTGTLYVADNGFQDGKRSDGQIVVLKRTK